VRREAHRFERRREQRTFWQTQPRAPSRAPKTRSAKFFQQRGRQFEFFNADAGLETAVAE
jgi:hypothetical protein